MHRLAAVVALVASPLLAQPLPLTDGLIPQPCNPVLTRPCTVLYTDATMPIPTLVYGASGDAFSITRTAINGLNYVRLTFIEPNQTAAFRRVFTVRVNDGLPQSIDVWAAAGLKKPLTITLGPVLVTDNAVRVTFKGVTGNAMVSAIEVAAMHPINGSIETWLACGLPTDPNTFCAQAQYVELRTFSGELRKLWAIPVPLDGTMPDISKWFGVR